MKATGRALPALLAVFTCDIAVLIWAPTPYALAAPRIPSVNESSASAVTQTSAILNATINPRGQDTHYHFEYGLTPADGTSIPVPNADVGPGTGELVVGQKVTGLQPMAIYHFKIVVEDAEGDVESEDQTFTTLPLLPPIEVSTQPATNISQNYATLTGTLNAQGVQTMYEFDVGQDTSYGTRIFGSADASTGQQSPTVTIQDLQANTTYHYRIQATNIYGSTYGADETFTTPPYSTAFLASLPVSSLVPTVLIVAKPATTTKAIAHIDRSHTNIHKTSKRAPHARRRDRRTADRSHSSDYLATKGK